MALDGHPSLFQPSWYVLPLWSPLGFILCVVIISVNSTTNPHALSEKPSWLHSPGVLILDILRVCFPYVPKSTSFVSPTLYFSVFPALTALAIVFHESSAKETVFIGSSGTTGVFEPIVGVLTCE